MRQGIAGIRGRRIWQKHCLVLRGQASHCTLKTAQKKTSFLKKESNFNE
jgi:hypothetical protein